ncbi:MAG: gamma-glutamyl-gamma-aminobutyrate hydrolase family protein [Micrococcales bacterium]|nr:gamma-glutamyl-gamma-aminobutyrate hydrolase family protein [Micrococcales bacterium]
MTIDVLVVDNYDSFVYTIVGYLRQLGASVDVVRNDALGDVEAAVRRADGVLVSPGPGAPSEAGASGQVVRACAAAGVPLLGVCLGHQVLGEVFGGSVTHAPELMHGKTSPITHDGTGVLAGLPSPFTATRYHSLAVVAGSVPAALRVTAWAHGTVMGLAHRTLPLHGVQFHPESVLTQGGHRILANWLALCGDDQAVTRAAGLRPLVPA